MNGIFRRSIQLRVVAFAFLLWMLLVGSSTSYAARRPSLLETAGVSLAVGAVLGLSTLPFYKAPLTGWPNILIGAGIGVGVGLIIWGYETYSYQSARDGFASNRIQFFVSGSFRVSSTQERSKPWESSQKFWPMNPEKMVTQVWVPVASISW